MACNCKVLKSKFERLQTKYITLKRNHKRLLGLTILLTDVLEDSIKQGVNSEIISEIESYATLYPDLLGNKKSFKIVDDKLLMKMVEFMSQQVKLKENIMKVF
ncbi:hypothetical protein Phum_PHUM517070 [Pediculus humanus corporis]|uniref:Uncharacterized protein n=1 Tax=Pediculus humanus subsp. corporis TaxID=121224 RepID=E0VYQ8_PEDHC|nr:uncharacterized protein Phum_PHUM517070 [Pediculus humanus corporis]EEB18514.1 hypothetical protein Phum_PHUM517070 [Pediculus humanus corporis]